MNPHKDFLIVGYTARDHLLLDLDDTSQTKAESLAKQLIRQYPNIGDCLIVQSSDKPLTITLKYRGKRRVEQHTQRNNYHLIFDNQIGYNTCVRICQTLAGLNLLERSFIRMRYFRGDMTLRVSRTLMTNGTKPAPKIIKYIVNTKTRKRDGYILHYLRLLRITRRLFRGETDTETKADHAANGRNNRAEQRTVETTQ